MSLSYYVIYSRKGGGMMNDLTKKLLGWKDQLGNEEITEGIDNVLVNILDHLAKQERELLYLRKKTASYEYFLRETDQLKYFSEDVKH